MMNTLLTIARVVNTEQQAERVSVNLFRIPNVRLILILFLKLLNVVRMIPGSSEDNLSLLRNDMEPNLLFTSRYSEDLRTWLENHESNSGNF